MLQVWSSGKVTHLPMRYSSRDPLASSFIHNTSLPLAHSATLANTSLTVNSFFTTNMSPISSPLTGRLFSSPWGIFFSFQFPFFHLSCSWPSFCRFCYLVKRKSMYVKAWCEDEDNTVWYSCFLNRVVRNVSKLITKEEYIEFLLENIWIKYR